MKTKTFGTFLSLFLLLAIGLVYAHGSSNDDFDRDTRISNHMMMFEDIDDMNEMHEEMTSNLDAKEKEIADEYHRGCIGDSVNFDDHSEFRGMMR